MRKTAHAPLRALVIGLSCFAALITDAREPTSFPNQRRDDSRLVPRLTGVPQLDTTPTPSGATLLPYAMPPGNYTNNASYPLLLVVTPPGKSCWALSVYVNGQLMASARDDCEYTNTSITVLVPAQSSFQINGDITATTRVTAMASGASWSQTGINFDYYSGAVSTTRSETVGTVYCTWTDYTTYWTNIYNGKTRNETQLLNAWCTDPNDRG